MPEFCATLSGQKPFSFGLDPWTLTYVVMPIIAITPLATYIMLPLLMRRIGSLLGWYLRKKTEGRRAQLLELMTAEQDALKQSDWVSKKSSGDKDRRDKDATWSGIVGFFHPFWCVPINKSERR